MQAEFEAADVLDALGLHDADAAPTPRERHGRLRKIRTPQCDVWYNGHRRWIVTLQRKAGCGSLHVYPDAQIALHQLGLQQEQQEQRQAAALRRTTAPVDAAE